MPPNQARSPPLLGGNDTGPECHSFQGLVASCAADDAGTVEVKRGANDMRDPLVCRNQRIQLCGFTFD